MADTTPNYHLIKPSEEDFYDIEDFNANADIIDSALGDVSTQLANKASQNDVSAAVSAHNSSSSAHSDIRNLIAARAAKSTAVNITIPAASWSGTAAPFTQSVTVSGMTAAANAILSPRSTVTQAQLEAFAAALMVVYSQGTNTITLYAYGDKPTVDISATMILLG